MNFCVCSMYPLVTYRAFIIIVYVEISPLSNLIKINLHKWHVCRTHNFPGDRVQSWRSLLYVGFTNSKGYHPHIIYLPYLFILSSEYAKFEPPIQTFGLSQHRF